MFKIITKVSKGKWKVVHPDGQKTYHKTKKEAQTYEHTLLKFGPFPVEYKHEQST